ncbi:MAG: hypothetical protein KAS32_04185 [Candidatus Peribacteraceae bacterium]|nr:hypothetical protein [Candidatus Peribacteraceae bacterium]
MKRHSRKKARYLIFTHYPSQLHRADTALELKQYIDKFYGLSRGDHRIVDTQTEQIVPLTDIVDGKKVKKDIERKLRK